MFRYIIATILISAVICDDHFEHCQKDWAKHHGKDAVETGVNIFYHFFEQHPDVKHEFPKFKDVDMAHLKEDVHFKEHSGKIYNVMDNMIMKHNWDDVEHLSQFHHEINKVQKDQFNAFRASFIDWMHLDDDHKGHWDHCMDIFYNHLFAKF